MKLAVDSFRGEVPLVSPRGLPDNAAQSAINARLQTGDLESWRQFLSTKNLANAGPVQTIYLLKDKWLSWDQQVDVARSVIPGDTSYRVYLTCPDLYDTPRWTDYTMATTGSEPFPVATLPIGVPAPDTVPTGVVGTDPTPATFTVDVSDPGETLSTDWQVSAPVEAATFNSHVTQLTSGGTPDDGPCYQLSWRDFGDQPGDGTWMKRNFGVADATATSFDFDFWLDGPGGVSRIAAGVQRTEYGAGVSVMIFGISGNWVILLGTADGWNQGRGQTTLVQSAGFTTLSLNTWWHARITVSKGANGDLTVAAFVSDPSDGSILGSVSSTFSSEVGDWCGFAGGEDQQGSTAHVKIDNILLHATGPTDYVPVNEATSYVYTFVNDIGQESAPSLASDTISRPQGVTVTVTTPTDVPGGLDPDYNIVEKRIYRAVSGSAGTAFQRVGTIPLATADFVDDVSDENSGPVLESDEWDLPPNDLQGIISLPNAVMAGFFSNQLCFSVQGRPHAWRVRDRKTTDTDIVAICNIDTTVVVGTQSFAYTATGTSNDNYSMSQPGEAQACVSKLGMVFLDGQGVAFPSPDGYQLCSGSAGSLRNITGSIFTQRQWQALNPESIIAAVHDGVLHWFYDNGSTPEESDVLVVNMEAMENGNFGGDTVNLWTMTPLTASDYAGIHEGETDEIEITQAGVYEVALSTRLLGNYGVPDTHFKNYSTIFGTRVVSGLPSEESHHNVNAGGFDLGGEVMDEVQFTDQFVLIVGSGDLPFRFIPETFAISYQDSFSTYAATMSVVVRRSGDHIGG